MSVGSQPLESSNWKPTPNEIAELLLSLGISPPQSLDENLFATSTDSDRSDSTSQGRTDSVDPGDPGSESRSVTPTNENFDRKVAIERLRIVTEDGILINRKNNLFHEHLVEHFRRKQMMHVYTDESEDDALLNEYLRKLDDLEKSNEELEKFGEEWDVELSRMRANIRSKKQESRNAIEAMISEERSVGTSTWYCGKPLGLKRVQTLINRQLDRIRDVAKFRLRYTRLRDELISREMELRDIMISRPNLTKEDYERLEAEQFYYKRELRSKEIQHEILMKRRSNLISRIDSMRRRMAATGREMNECEKTIDGLRNEIKINLKKKKIGLAILVEAKCFIREFGEVIGRSNTTEFVSTIENIRKEHDEWMKKISKILREIEAMGQSLNAVRANLNLHGKVLERNTTDSGIKTPTQPTIGQSDDTLK